jgi:hypothetical protein
LTLGWSTLLWLTGEDARLNEAGNELATVATKKGDVAGISLLRSGSNAFRATSAQVRAPHNIALLARAL